MNVPSRASSATPSVGGPPRPAAELPPAGGSFAVWGVTLLGGFAAFLYFLNRHEARTAWICLGVTLVASFLMQRMLPGLRERSELKNARKEGGRLLKAVRTALKKQATWTGTGTKEKIETAAVALENVLPTTDTKAIEAATKQLDDLADQSLARKAAIREYSEQIGGALLAALLLRAFFYEAFKIPSTSMVPTLLVGDHLFVNKFVYGFRIPFTLNKINAKIPERGDIVVFNKPGDEGGDDIIKRVIGLPGDTVEVSNRHVTINGEPLETKPLDPIQLSYRTGDPAASYKMKDGEPDTEDGPFHTYQPFEEVVGDHTHIMLESTQAFQQSAASGRWVVEDGHVFVMGDNRDNSQDSRFGRREGGFGQVPVNHIKGRADIIWLSLGGPHGVRFDRMFKLLK